MLRAIRVRPHPASPVATGVARSTGRFPLPPALRIADYRWLWSGNSVALLARWIDIAVLSWVIVQVTDSAFLVSLVAFARIAPFMLAGPVAGLVADRFDRLAIVRATRLTLAVVAGVFAVLLLTDALVLWHVYALVAAGGIVWTFDSAAQRTLTPDIVDGRRLTNAIALDVMAFMGMSVAGPALAGALLPVIHADLFFVGLAVMLAMSAVILIRVASPGAVEGPREPFFASFAGGLRIVRSNRILLAILLMTAVAEGFAYAYIPLIPVFATDIMNAGAGGLGLLLAAQGIGALLSGAAVAAAGDRIRSHGRVMVFAMILTVATGLALAGSRTLLLSFGLLALQGVFVGTYVTMQNNIVMLLTPRCARGRLVGLQMLVIGAFPLSALAVGALADVLSPQLAVAIMAGIGLLLIAALQVALPELRRYRNGDDNAPATADARAD